MLICIASLFAFKMPAPKSKLFQPIEKFYADLSGRQPEKERATTLQDLSSYILRGSMSDQKIDLVFTCEDNSFKSMSAQIVLQSLLSSNKINKLIVHSCGYQPKEVSPQLIKVLIKHGFQVNEQSKATNGKTAYSIKFGDNMQPLTVYAKDPTDGSLPKSNYFLMKLCSISENKCADLQGAQFKYNLPIENASETISEEEADKQFTAIAADIVYAFNKSKL